MLKIRFVWKVKELNIKTITYLLNLMVDEFFLFYIWSSFSIVWWRPVPILFHSWLSWVILIQFTLFKISSITFYTHYITSLFKKQKKFPHPFHLSDTNDSQQNGPFCTRDFLEQTSRSVFGFSILSISTIVVDFDGFVGFTPELHYRNAYITYAHIHTTYEKVHKRLATSRLASSRREHNGIDKKSLPRAESFSKTLSSEKLIIASSDCEWMWGAFNRDFYRNNLWEDISIKKLLVINIEKIFIIIEI